MSVVERDKQALSDITVFNKYAKFIEEFGRRENWEEIVTRNMNMHIAKYPTLEDQIRTCYKDYVLTKRILPSMRSLQFGGRPIEMSNSRMFNCAYAPAESPKFFSELMFLLLGGTGMGYSVQQRHVGKLPVVRKPETIGGYTYQVQDSIIGWADAVKTTVKAFFSGSDLPEFDYRDIRDKGSELVTTGGKAPGAEPLKACINNLVKVLTPAAEQQRKLRPIEVHDMACIIADAVLAGGIRRAAMICLFDRTNEEMLTCKATVPVMYYSVGSMEASGVTVTYNCGVGLETAVLSQHDYNTLLTTNTLPWYIAKPARARANNSAVLLRGAVTQAEFYTLMQRVDDSKCGEPGVYWTNNLDWGTNPCCLSGDTKLLTSKGYMRLDELVGTTFDNINMDGDVSKGKVWSNGIKDVIELKFIKKASITCTPDHTFMDVDGNSIEAKDLKGKRLMPYYCIKSSPKDITAFKAGFILGDGMLSRLESTTHKSLEVCIGSKDLEVGAYFGVSKAGNVYSKEAYEIAISYGLKGVTTPTRELPDEVSADFMMGLYSANGSVIKHGKRIALKTSSSLMRDQVCAWLFRNGMTPYVTTNKGKDTLFSNGSYACKESYDINLCGIDNLTMFARTVSFVHEYKRNALEEAILNSAPMVVSVKPKGAIEVYDFSEPKLHWGVIEGVIVHNCEIALEPYQMCNLTEINAGVITTQKEFNDVTGAATFIGTLQAGYTAFHYLNPKWKETCNRGALLGVSMTGIAAGSVVSLNLIEAAKVATEINKYYAGLIGINPAERVTCVKPAGTTSLVLGVASGIHSWHNDYYIRRMRAGKDEALAQYLMRVAPKLVEQDVMNPKQVVLSFPQKAPVGACVRTEPMMELLNRVKKVSQDWVQAGHVIGHNTHNVSCTISVKDDEWGELVSWMWKNRNYYNGISVLPYFGAEAYPQLPFEDCTEEQYNELLPLLDSIDIGAVFEQDGSGVDLAAELACAGGVCELK
jgi:hypothetical protein